MVDLSLPAAEEPSSGRAAPAPHVWMLADDRPGNVNQALGLAEALGEPFAIKTVGYGQLARLPNWLLPANLSGLTPATRENAGPALAGSWSSAPAVARPASGAG